MKRTHKADEKVGTEEGSTPSISLKNKWLLATK